MYPIRPFTEGMTPLPIPPEHANAFKARSAGNQAWAAAAQRGASGEECMEAWQRAHDETLRAG